MTSQNLEQSLEISKMCQDILYVSPNTIRCSSFINKYGRITESKLCDDRKNNNVTNLTDKELEMLLYMQCKLQGDDK